MSMAFTAFSNIKKEIENQGLTADRLNDILHTLRHEAPTKSAGKKAERMLARWMGVVYPIAQ